MTDDVFERAARLFAVLSDATAQERDERLRAEGDSDVCDLVREMLAGADDLSPALSTGVPGLRGLVDEALRESEEDVDGAPEIELALEGGVYRIDGVLARGGMGTVYRGRDVAIGRVVAIKVLHGAPGADSEASLRFIEEAQVAGQLEHPGIVPVHHLGHDDRGRPFFVMKLIEGRTLAELLGERESAEEDLSRYLGVFLRVCQTVAYAHARGVIHRDLKPANVMVGAFGEVQVLDWGLAKVLEAKSVELSEEPVAGTRPRPGGSPSDAGSEVGDHAAPLDDSTPPPTTVRSGSSGTGGSLAGTVMGTPGYMSPEQADGDVAAIGRGSDVFALGAILCQILTGAPPFEGDRREALRATRDRALGPALERLAQCQAESALVELAQHCLAAGVEDRPVDAGDLAVAVERSLAAVEARARETVLQAEREAARADSERRARRTRVRLMALAGLFLIVVAFGLVWYVFDRKATIERRTGEARAAIDLAEERLRGAQAAVVGDLGPWESALVAVEAAVREDGEDVRSEVRARLDKLRRGFEAEWSVAEASALRKAFDESVLERLEVIRAPTADGVEPYDYPRLRREYEKLFQDLELPVEDYQATAAALRGHRLGAALGRALDQWSVLHLVMWDQEDPDRMRFSARLMWMASAADPDPGREGVRAAMRAGDTDRLLELAGEASDPDPETVLLLSGALRFRGKLTEAVELLCRVSRRRSGDFWLTLHTAIAVRALAAEKRGAEAGALYQQAQSYFRAAVGIRPASREARHLLGQTLEQMGRYGEARDEFIELLRLAPRDGHAMAHLGRAMAKVSGSEAALPRLEEAVTLAPKDLFALPWLAHALTDTGNFWRAVEMRRATFELQPNAFHGQRYASALSQAGDVPGELAMWDKVVGLAGRDHRALYNAGTAYSNAGYLDRARKLLLRCAEVAPEMVQVRCNLALIDLRRGEFEGALAGYRGCHEAGSKSPRWPYPSAGWVARAQRAVEFGKALSEYDREQEAGLSPASPVISLEAAEFAAFRGRVFLACEGFAAFLPELHRAPRLELDLAGLTALRAAASAQAAGVERQRVVEHIRMGLDWLQGLQEMLMADFRQYPEREWVAVRGWLGTWTQHPDLAWLADAERIPPSLRDRVVAFRRGLATDLQEICEVAERSSRAR